jgi:hypothetical protein
LKKEIYVNKPLSLGKIMELLDKYPNLKKISCPPSLYSRISPKYLQALDELGVEVEPVAKKGRPKKYHEKDTEKVELLLKSGHTPHEIAETLKLPLKTVYYLKDSPLKPGRKIEYDPQQVQKVKNLYKNGVSAKEISDNLKIPIRTVYSLLKR